MSPASIAGRHANSRKMNAAEVVIGKVQRTRCFQVRQFLAETICQAREPAHRHTHREILPLHEASRDVARVRIAARTLDITSTIRDWGVPRFDALVLAVITEQLHKLREVHVQPEGIGHASGVVSRPSVVICVLPLMRLVQVPQEISRVLPMTLANVERRNQLRVGIDRNEHPLIAKFG